MIRRIVALALLCMGIAAAGCAAAPAIRGSGATPGSAPPPAETPKPF